MMGIFGLPKAEGSDATQEVIYVLLFVTIWLLLAQW